MKKAIYNIFFFSLIVSGLTGCLKGDTPNIDPKAGTIVTLEYLAGGTGTTIGSGISNFGGAALLYPATHDADTAIISVILGGGASINKDVSVSISVDQNAILDNFANDSIAYEAMPDSLYHIISSTETIKAGEKATIFQVIFYPSKTNPLKNYMLPVKITDASGYVVSSNFDRVYFHTIGNPIAGVYNQEWIRYNTAEIAGTPAYDNDLGAKVFAPLNGTTVSTISGSGPKYLLSFTNTDGVLSDFKLSLDAKSVTDAGITISGSPSIVIADPVKGIYKFNYIYINSSGAARNITDIFMK